LWNRLSLIRISALIGTFPTSPPAFVSIYIVLGNLNPLSHNKLKSNLKPAKTPKKGNLLMLVVKGLDVEIVYKTNASIHQQLPKI